MTAPDGPAAVANGREYDAYDTGMCQKYVRGPCWEVGSLYGSAIEAWRGAADKHPDDRTPPVGAPCYYEGGQYGHAVIYVGGGRVRSTDTPSTGRVGEVPLDHFEREWGYAYLGWTNDLNGIDLPIGANDVALSQQDFDRIRDIVSDEVAKRVGDVVPWPTDTNPDNLIMAKTALAEIQDTQKRIDKANAKLDTLLGDS